MARYNHDEDEDRELPKGRGSSFDDDDDDDSFGNSGDDDLDKDEEDFDDLADDDDDPAAKPTLKSRKGKGASAEDKYADYLMYRDTGSAHDDALDLANMTDSEYRTMSASRADSADDEDDDLFASNGGEDDEDDDDSSFTHGAGRSGRGDDDY